MCVCACVCVCVCVTCMYVRVRVCSGSIPAASTPGEEWRGRPPPIATVRVLNMDFFYKVVLRHDTGLGEAYMDQVCMSGVGGRGRGHATVTQHIPSPACEPSTACGCSQLTCLVPWSDLLPLCALIDRCCSFAHTLSLKQPTPVT